MEQHSMILQVLTIITFLFATLKNAQKMAQFISLEVTKFTHYLKILYLIDANPLQMVDLFTLTADS